MTKVSLKGAVVAGEVIHRAYSTIDIKSADANSGIIEGIASTPSPDGVGDIMEPKGAVFKLPMPLLWMHDSKQPIGQVTQAKVTSKGIEIKAKVMKGLLPEIDRAWTLITAGLVRGLSIGFRGIEAMPAKGEIPGGLHFIKWAWHELSAVTIPMNTEANIVTVKAADINPPDIDWRALKIKAMPKIEVVKNLPVVRLK